MKPEPLVFPQDVEQKMLNAYVEWLAAQTLPWRDETAILQQQIFLLSALNFATLFIAGCAYWRIHSLGKEQRHAASV